MKKLKVAIPIFVAIMAAVGIGANYMSGNSEATWASFSALLGWLIVSGNNIVDYINEKKYTG